VVVCVYAATVNLASSERAVAAVGIPGGGGAGGVDGDELDGGDRDNQGEEGGGVASADHVSSRGIGANS
jgi:hypothetical protein